MVDFSGAGHESELVSCSLRPLGGAYWGRLVIRFNLRLWQRFRAIAALYWLRDERWPATGLLVLLVLLLLGQTGFSVLFNQLTGEFTSALAARDADRFWKSIVECVAILVFAVPIYAFY